jgi:hypothetical protein
MNEAASAAADTSGLIDIIEPAVPVVVESGSGLWLAAAVVLVTTLAGGFFYLWKYRLPAYRARKSARDVQRQVLAGELTLHESILVFALELRQGLAIKRLRAEEVPVVFSQKDAALWAEFMQNLEAMLYQSGADVTAEKQAVLYAQIEKWLWRYGR